MQVICSVLFISFLSEDIFLAIFELLFSDSVESFFLIELELELLSIIKVSLLEYILNK